MSAHAIQARRDLADLFVLFLELLEPLFLFLLDGRRTVKLPTPTDRQDTGVAVADVATVTAGPAVVEPLPVAGPADCPTPNASEVTALVAPAAAGQEVPAGDSPAVGPTPDEYPAAVACGLSAPAGRFVKVGGRFRPAPDGHAGPTFRRVVSAGGRTRYAAA